MIGERAKRLFLERPAAGVELVAAKRVRVPEATPFFRSTSGPVMATSLINGRNAAPDIHKRLVGRQIRRRVDQFDVSTAAAL